MIIWIIVLLLYAYLGDKANQFCKRHILHLETVYVFDVGSWVTNRALWGVLIGWFTIPVAIIIWILGARG